MQKVTDRLYFTYLQGIPYLTEFDETGIRVGVANGIKHTKFGNDRSREYKVTLSLHLYERYTTLLVLASTRNY